MNSTIVTPIGNFDKISLRTNNSQRNLSIDIDSNLKESQRANEAILENTNRTLNSREESQIATDAILDISPEIQRNLSIDIDSNIEESQTANEAILKNTNRTLNTREESQAATDAILDKSPEIQNKTDNFEVSDTECEGNINLFNISNSVQNNSQQIQTEQSNILNKAMEYSDFNTFISSQHNI